MTLVKICGIQTLADALAAIEAGAWAIGEVFTFSRRRINPEEARWINQCIPPRVVKVGVFVNEKIENVDYISRYAQLDIVQLHGQESPEYTSEIKLPVIKAFAVEKEIDLAYIHQWRPWAYLFDSGPGGSGEVFDWSWLKPAKGMKNIILAGGLNGSNVTKAIQEVRPMAVDISSGVESCGRKDPAAITRFINKVKDGDRELIPSGSNG